MHPQSVSTWLVTAVVLLIGGVVATQIGRVLYWDDRGHGVLLAEPPKSMPSRRAVQEVVKESSAKKDGDIYLTEGAGVEPERREAVVEKETQEVMADNPEDQVNETVEAQAGRSVASAHQNGERLFRLLNRVMVLEQRLTAVRKRLRSGNLN